jgi:hypothetical protein
MKKLLLSMAVVAMLFSCSKDNVETETTANLSSTIAVSTAIEFSGVFGHHENRALHGKLIVTIDSNNSQAEIHMVNGEVIEFQGSQLSKDATTIYFNSNRGSFTFDALAEQGQRVSNLEFDNVTDAYMVSVEVPTRGGGLVLLGTYEETGNEANFYGNWDLVGDGIDTDFFGDNGQYVGATIVTHKGTVGPFVDTTYEVPAGTCTGGLGMFLWTRGVGISVFGHNQNSDFVGPNTTWGMEWRCDDPSGSCSYVDELCSGFGSAPSGFWSWAGRTGSMVVVTPPSPIQNDNNSTNIATVANVNLAE